MKRKRQVIITIMLFLSILFNFVFSAQADDFDFFSLGDSYIRKYVDCTNIEPSEFTWNDTEPNECSVWFMFADGNQLIWLVHNGIGHVYAFIQDDELLSALFQMVISFDEIESQLPEGSSLRYVIQYSDDERAYINSETMGKYYSWINKN